MAIDDCVSLEILRAYYYLLDQETKAYERFEAKKISEQELLDHVYDVPEILKPYGSTTSEINIFYNNHKDDGCNCFWPANIRYMLFKMAGSGDYKRKKE